jgi:hypothetical protein
MGVKGLLSPKIDQLICDSQKQAEITVKLRFRYMLSESADLVQDESVKFNLIIIFIESMQLN